MVISEFDSSCINKAIKLALGAGTVIGHMPTYFEEQFSKIEWIGPASPEECDPLFARIKSLERRRNLGIT